MAGMERNTGFNTTTTTKDLKHKSCCFMASHLMKKSNNNDNVKESSYYYGNNEDDGLMCWPPRCYTCSFCKREFKSAQALGGHMNVHRRDRAKLLMGHNSPPPPPPPPPTDKYRYSLQNLNLQPNSTNNPSPNISSSAPPPPSPSRKFSHYSSWGKGVVPNNDHLKSSSSTANDSFCMQEIFFVRLDLGIGLLTTESKQDLDLELRLGYT